MIVNKINDNIKKFKLKKINQKKTSFSNENILTLIYLKNSNKPKVPAF